MQLDIWASLASALALPSVALPEMDRSALAAYVKEEQDTYASFAREAVKKKVRDDRFVMIPLLYDLACSAPLSSY